jgi:hypothetical protein
MSVNIINLNFKLKRQSLFLKRRQKLLFSLIQLIDLEKKIQINVRIYSSIQRKQNKILQKLRPNT